MRYYIPILFLSFALLFGCQVSKQYLEKGQYDSAIRQSVKKLRKNPTKEKEIVVLKRAYDLAYERDNDRIKFLKMEGKPEVWDEVFSLYVALKNRQTLVKTVLPLKMKSGEKVNFKMVDYDAEILAAKKKAAEYFYAHGKMFLKKNDKMAAREAYYDFGRVKDYYSSYKDVDDLLIESRNKGISTALIKVINKSRIVVSRRFVDDLLNIGVSNLNKKWVVYDTKKTQQSYDYNVIVSIKNIDMSGEKLREKHYEKTKEIKDGFEYVKDEHGNVMKDTLGNDIKKPRYITVKCKVLEIHQHKSVRIFGTVDYVDNRTKQIMLSKEVTAENFFDYASGTALGDMRALDKESKKFLGRLPTPFPHDEDMIEEAGKVLKKVVYDLLVDNRRFLK